MTTKVDVVIYVQSIDNGHITVSKDKLPINAVILSLHHVKVTNIFDANGRLMLTIDRVLAEHHGLIAPSIIAPTRASQPPLPAPAGIRAMTEKPVPAPAPEPDDSENEAELNRAIAEAINLRDVTPTRPTSSGVGLLARAGVSRRT